jgi:cytochrome P450
MIACYATARALFNDPRLGKDVEAISAIARHKLAQAGRDTTLPPFYSQHMLMSDPPEHSRLRGVVSRSFTPDRVERLRPRIEAICASLLDSLPLDRPVDLIEGFAFDLPVLVIGELLGVPAVDRNQLREWSTALIQERPEVSLPAGGAVLSYLRALIATMRVSPSDDLLSELASPAGGGEVRLSEDELLSTALLLLVAGHETTGNLIGNGIHWILAQPQHIDALQRMSETMPSAIEELLRHDPPVSTTTMRFTREPVEVHGIEIPAGELVLFSLAAANRDPAQFVDPDTFCPGRDGVGHLAFGYGRHYCLGASLARVEAEIALRGFVRRFPQARLAVDASSLKRRAAPLMNGFEQLPVWLAAVN